MASFAVESGSCIFVKHIFDKNPVLDWDGNLFILACSKQQHELVFAWGSICGNPSYCIGGSLVLSVLCGVR